MSLRGKASRSNAGFTLIEMLVVIIILGILAMVIVPQISTSTDDAKLSTLQTNLTSMRGAVEMYYAQHEGSYPAAAIPTTKPVDVTTLEHTFAAQMTRYTDAKGNIANVKSTTYKYGPYMKGSLPMNPFNDLSDVTIDNTEDDITVKASSGSTAWKFYSLTGVTMADDGSHDNE